MTEQEITQAHADVDQLDIEQLRCGVLLQLLHIERITKERDECRRQSDLQTNSAIKFCQERNAVRIERDDALLAVDQWRVDYHELSLERDALAADAERYRWITKHIVSGDMDSLEKAFAKLDPYAESVTQAEFDAVIDAAIQAVEPATGERAKVGDSKCWQQHKEQSHE